MTTHSPYFVQHVPLRDLRLVRLRGGQTEVSALPRSLVSNLAWNDALDGFLKGGGGRVFAQGRPVRFTKSQAAPTFTAREKTTMTLNETCSYPIRRIFFDEFPAFLRRPH